MLGFEALAESPLATLPTAGGAVTHATTGALTGQGSTVAGSSSSATNRPSSGVLVGPGSVVAGSAARSGAALTHDTSGALIGAGSVVAGAVERIRIHASSGALVGPGSVVYGAAIGPASSSTAITGGIGHGGKRKKPQIAVITVDGQDYRVPIDQVQAFLDRMREQVVEPEQAIAKVEKKKAKAPKKAYEPPVIVVKSAPPDVMQMITARVDRSNEIIRKMWEGTILRRIREMEIDDEEAILLLLAA